MDRVIHDALEKIQDLAIELVLIVVLLLDPFLSATVNSGLGRLSKLGRARSAVLKPNLPNGSRTLRRVQFAARRQ